MKKTSNIYMSHRNYL